MREVGMGMRGRMRAGGHGARRACAAIGLGIGVVVLSGCAPAAAPAPTVTVVVTPTPTPTPTPTVVLPQPTATVYAPAPVPTVTITPNDVPVVPQTAYAYDSGSTTGASGSPALDAQGDPIAYTVVQGDTFFDIAQRFGIPVQQLLRMNPSVAGAGEAVYIGTRIELDANVLG